MKIKELRDKTDQELDKLLAELRDTVRDLRFRIAARRLTDVRQVREAKKAIARVLTLRRSRKEA
ncbi:MAG: Ribosomal protein [Candidatus Parcubacteria bacterium]|jgi:large subunit ribosomal protein L29